MTFDARSLKLLAPGKYITSPDFPGLRFEAFESCRTWTYRYRSPVDGKLKQKKIGQWPDVSTHSAIAEWEKLRSKRESGEDPVAEVRKAKVEARREAKARADLAEYTVAHCCDDYYEGYVLAHRAKKGAYEIRRMFNTMLGPMAVMPVVEVTRADAFDLINMYSKTTPVLAASLRTELGAAWDYAMDAGRIPESVPNWWRRILRGKVRSKGRKILGENIGTTKRTLTPVEVGTLIRWLPNFSQLVDDGLTLYLWTGTRGAEIAGMRGDEVNREDDGILWWTIPKDRTKNARHEGATDMRVPLFGRAETVVLRRKGVHGDGYLFPAKVAGKPRPVEQKVFGVGVHYVQPYSRTHPQYKRARLPVVRWSPHDLRRTARTFLASLGCPDSVGESILGHMLPGVIGIYNKHTYDDERAVWLKKLSDYLETLAASE